MAHSFKHLCHSAGTIIRMLGMNPVNEPKEFLFVFLFLPKDRLVIYSWSIYPQEYTLSTQRNIIIFLHHFKSFFNTAF